MYAPKSAMSVQSIPVLPPKRGASAPLKFFFSASACRLPPRACNAHPGPENTTCLLAAGQLQLLPAHSLNGYACICQARQRGLTMSMMMH